MELLILLLVSALIRILLENNTVALVEHVPIFSRHDIYVQQAQRLF